MHDLNQILIKEMTNLDEMFCNITNYSFSFPGIKLTPREKTQLPRSKF